MLAPDSPAAAEAVELLVGALKANQAFQAAAWPDAMLRPLFCRYGVGMKYGDHVDGAIMGDPASQVRCDVAMTVCLSDATEYEGGELIIDAAGVPTGWRGKAGDLDPVPGRHASSGERKSPAARATSRSRGSRAWCARGRAGASCSTSRPRSTPSTPCPTPPVEAEAIRRSYLNLIRMWA